MYKVIYDTKIQRTLYIICYKKKGMSNKLRNTRRQSRETSRIKQVFTNYINNNKKEYMLVILIFIIGIVIGVIFINKSTQIQTEEVTTFINEFILKIKANNTINRIELLKEQFISNFVLALTMWFVGSTVVGMPIVYAIIGYKGFCIGYTISSIMLTLGSKGILFSICSMLLQNIIWIPCLLALAVSGICLYKSIMKDKRKENIKLEITRHTVFCVLVMLAMQISVLVEVYVSTGLIQLVNSYL